MRWVLFIILSIILVSTSYANEIERLQYDFDGDGVQDSIALNIQDNWDVGVFTNITVSFSSGKSYSFDNLDAWDTVSESVGSDLLTWIQANNLLPSDNVVLIKETKSKYLVFAFGYAYGSSPGELSIYRISSHGMTSIFKEEFLPTKIIVKANNLPIEMIGLGCFSQKWGVNYQCTTYDPYNVFTLGEQALLNKESTKEYNLEHYYGYAGPNCSEEIAVYEENGRKTLLDKENTIKLCRP